MILKENYVYYVHYEELVISYTHKNVCSLKWTIMLIL